MTVILNAISNFILSKVLYLQLVYFQILWLWFFGEEDVGEDYSNDEENDNDNQTFPEPSFSPPHPLNTLKFLFLGMP